MISSPKFDTGRMQGRFDPVRVTDNKKEQTSRYDKFEVSWQFCVAIDGTPAKCKRPCIDMNKVYCQDDDGDTLLHIAIITAEPDLAFYIIDFTASSDWLNVKNKLSQTPLHAAVLTNQVPVVRRLVIGGADIEARDCYGNMPVHIACREGMLDIVRALVEPVSFEEQQRNNCDNTFNQLHQKCNLNAENYEGVPRLHIAAANGLLDIVKLLLKYGADVNAKAEKSGRTILHEAAWHGNLNLVKFLVSFETTCNINAKTYDDYTAFDLARSHGHWSIVAELAMVGADYEDKKQEIPEQ